MKSIAFLFFFTVSCIASNGVAANLGSVSGAWEANGHWVTAGDIGAVCEHRPGAKKPYKVKIYRKAGELYQEFAEYRFWPNSCNVSTADLQREWGSIGTFVEDGSFLPENGDKYTQRRWTIR